jgi:hypothetical protein
MRCASKLLLSLVPVPWGKFSEGAARAEREKNFMLGLIWEIGAGAVVTLGYFGQPRPCSAKRDDDGLTTAGCEVEDRSEIVWLQPDLRLKRATKPH